MELKWSVTMSGKRYSSDDTDLSALEELASPLAKDIADGFNGEVDVDDLDEVCEVWRGEMFKLVAHKDGENPELAYFLAKFLILKHLYEAVLAVDRINLVTASMEANHE